MKTSFLEYAYSVIYARALPDARDGLKPVQRRIMYQMSQMNLYPDRPYVKSARVVGDVMGKLHPHGDSAIYEAMVRMAQDFSMRLPMVDGHGNFGSPDNGPAASRYTEAKMSRASAVMCANLDEDVVDFEPNYDNKLQQPSVLPSAIPNLLVNGGTGIAVGMATNMVPHNLREVINGAVFLMNNPEASTKELMKYIPGPDLPTGGRIVGLEPIREAYETGRGIFQMFAKTSIEKIGKKQVIVVTELPYQVGPERLIEKISDAVKKGKIQGIAKADDLTDRHSGTRIEIVVKNGFNPQAVLNRLYKITPLQESFGINNVALVYGAPKTLGLKELLQIWIDHRIEVIRRRTQFRLNAREDRLHLVEGLLIAILDIDEVIQIIRDSDDTTQANIKLQKVFDLDEIQANYILDLRLRRLTKFSRIELEDEKSKLLDEIKHLKEILQNEDTLKNEVINIMHETASEYGDDRRTVLVDSDSSIQSGLNNGGSVPNSTKQISSSNITFADLGGGLNSDDLILPSSNNPSNNNADPFASKNSKTTQWENDANLHIQDTPCYVLQSATGLVARVVRSSSETSKMPPQSITRAPHDAINVSIKTTSRSNIGVLTSSGRVIVVSVLELPEIGRGDEISLNSLEKDSSGNPIIDSLEIGGLSGGISLSTLTGRLNDHETPISIIELPATSIDGQVLDGDAAKKALDEFKPLTIGTLFGVVKRVKPEVPPHERSGTIRDQWQEINLDEGDCVVGVSYSDDTDEIVFIASDSSLLHYSAKNVRPQGRNAGGMAGIKLSPGAKVQFFGVVENELLSVVETKISDTENQTNVERIANKIKNPIVFTVAGDVNSLPGTENGSGKLTPFELYPGKGRATGGVRSQKFLRGQNTIIYAWVGRGDAKANTSTGTPADLPDIDMRRDGSGKLLDSPVTSIG